MVKKVITNSNLWKVFGPDCISVVVLKNCEPELSYILAELFNKCLKESCFSDCWKVLLVVPVFKNDGERSTTKNHRPVSLVSVVSKVVSNRIVYHLAGFPLVGEGWRGSPHYPKSWLVPPPCSPTVSTQKCRFSNFHVVFGHCAQISLFPPVDPIRETLPREMLFFWLPVWF